MTNGKWLMLVLVIGVLFTFRECQHYTEKRMMDKTLESVQFFMDQERQSFAVGMKLVTQDQKVMKQQLVESIDELKLIKEQYKDLKKISSVIKTELHTKIKGNVEIVRDTTYLAANTDTLIHRDTVQHYFVPKGSKAQKNDLWYDIYATIGDSLQIDSLKVRDKIDAVLGWQKPDKSFKWLRKREPVVSISSYNPHTEIGYVNNLVVKDEKSTFAKILSSRAMMILYGVAAGVTIRSLK